MNERPQPPNTDQPFWRDLVDECRGIWDVFSGNKTVREADDYAVAGRGFEESLDSLKGPTTTQSEEPDQIDQQNSQG